MDARAPHPAVLVSDPSYGPGLHPEDAETAPVDAGVEHREWAPIDPAPGQPIELALVDGAQQVEAWLTVTPPGEATALPGAGFAIAAGAVLATAGAPARIEGVVVRRHVLTVGDRRLDLPPTGGFSWEPRAGAAQEATGLARRVGDMRQELELTLAEGLTAEGRLVVLDGPLHFLRDAKGPVVGAVKSHHRMYLGPDEAACVVRLGVGQRTPLFAIGGDRLSWYQRLPGVGTGGWAGILRGEVARSAGVAEAARLADRAAAELPRFAGRAHRDPRAPQNLAPVAALEWRLRHRMGDRRLALRAVRRAAAGARLDQQPVAAVGVAEPERAAVAA